MPVRSSNPRVLGTSAVVLALSLAWTLLILLLPDFRFVVRVPRLAAAIATAGVIVALLTAALAWLRWSLSMATTWLMTGAAFGVLCVNQFVFGLILRPEVLGGQTSVYLWIAGRLIAGGLLLAGALRGAGRVVRRAPPVRGIAIVGGASLAVLAIADSLILRFRRALPDLSTVSLSGPEVITGRFPGLTPFDIGLGVFGTGLFLAAAAGYLRNRDPGSAWLAPPLVLAAASHVHLMLFPTAYTDLVSTGDLLRLAFSAALLAGLVAQVARVSISERDRAAELEAAYRAERDRAEQLERADRSREELFTMLTHDLLHPVAAIRSAMVLLARHWDEIDEGTRRDLAGRAERESGRLRDLAEEATTAIQTESPSFALHLRRVNPTELAREAEIVEGPALDGRLVVTDDASVGGRAVHADPSRILQVLRNLLSNARKFSPPGSRVELRVSANGDTVTFEVADEGPGIDPDQVRLLFQRSSRLPGTSAPGSGFGLFICRRIIEAHGGRIWHEPSSRGGSSFRFTLPAVAS